METKPKIWNIFFVRLIRGSLSFACRSVDRFRLIKIRHNPAIVSLGWGKSSQHSSTGSWACKTMYTQRHGGKQGDRQANKTYKTLCFYLLALCVCVGLCLPLSVHTAVSQSLRWPISKRGEKYIKKKKKRARRNYGLWRPSGRGLSLTRLAAGPLMNAAASGRHRQRIWSVNFNQGRVQPVFHALRGLLCHD